jgi:hypothetical protein
MADGRTVTNIETQPSRLGHGVEAHPAPPHLRAASHVAEPLPTELEAAHEEIVRLRRQNLGLITALATSRRIGAAIGVLMAHGRLTEQQAFDQLRQASMSQHVKLRDLAVEVIDTGTINPTGPANASSEPSRVIAKRAPLTGTP